MEKIPEKKKCIGLGIIHVRYRTPRFVIYIDLASHQILIVNAYKSEEYIDHFKQKCGVLK